ncbi:MAG TPA: aminotransferase class V-fold PLP-dependent enzyme [Thermomicrobiales bacterium]|nr:aminotransferase class V-fold PLP-dependent enzyme [Thermomicrobiales bacterium]
MAKSEFIGGDERAYLYTAGEGLVPRSVIAATERYYEDKVRAGEGRARGQAVEQECRAGLAALMTGATADDIALLGSTSEGVNAIYSLIDWLPGDNVVTIVNELEFPSVVLPAAKLEQRGVELRAVGHADWIVTPEMIGAAIDERTRLVVLSHVSYRTGFRHDLDAVSAIVRPANPNALFAVDATQSLGVIHVPANACDFLVATSCKWLLAPHGLGVFYWNRERLPVVEPAGIGWYSVVDDLQFPYDLKPTAGRFELGGPNLLSIYALNEGVKLLLETGVERIEAHALALGMRLLDGVSDLDLPVMTPRDPSLRAGIVAWEDPHNVATARKLAERDIYVTGSSGRIRAGIHLYNDESDVDRLVKGMREIVMRNG